MWDVSRIAPLMATLRFAPTHLCMEKTHGARQRFAQSLRSLNTNDPTLVIGRATLGSAAAPEVHLLTSIGNIEFRNGTWSAAYPDIEVFDATYISENVHAGDAVDTEQRRGLYRVIIGAQGVALAAQLNDLEKQIRDKNSDIRDNKTQIQRYTAEGMSVEALIGLAGRHRDRPEDRCESTRAASSPNRPYSFNRCLP